MLTPIMHHKTLLYFFSKAILLIVGLAALGCQSTPKNDYDINYDFSQLQSFNLVQALVSQGFIQTDNNADFMVSFAFQTETKPKSSGLSIGLGTGSWGSSGGASIGTSIGVPIGSDSAKMQTIQIDVIDPEGKRLIWRGTDKYDFEQGGELKAQKTAETVYHILQQFPPKPAK
jgi:hypothetical protein